MNDYTRCLVDDVAEFVKNKRSEFDASAVVQGIIDLLKKEKQDNGLDIDDGFFKGLEELKTDGDFITLVTRFNEALEGKRNMLSIGLLN